MMRAVWDHISEGRGFWWTLKWALVGLLVGSSAVFLIPLAMALLAFD